MRSTKHARHIGRLLRRRAHRTAHPLRRVPRGVDFPGKSLRVTWTITGGLVQTVRGLVGFVPRRAYDGPTGPSTSRTVGDGRYELLAPVGSGGGGKLYLAHDAVLDRTVAVKLLRPHQDEAARARLRTEARVAARLSHQGLAQAIDYGEDVLEGETSPYLVMEYVEGVTLSEQLRGGPLTAPRVADLLAQLADVLAAVHAAGVVHRDVKPANIVVTAAGRVVLLDFGVARGPDAEPLTLTGTIVGTLNYISPEQAAGEPATPRSDLYSLGMVAHEALTGVRALARETEAATLLAHLTGAAGPLPVDVPSDLRALVEQLVQRDPQRRPIDAAFVARRARSADLETVAARPVPLWSARPPRRLSEAGLRTFRVAPPPPGRPAARTWLLAEPRRPGSIHPCSATVVGPERSPDPGGSDV